MTESRQYSKSVTGPSRLAGPGSEREMIGHHAYLDLAKKHADRVGPGACVDAQGGTKRVAQPGV